MKAQEEACRKDRFEPTEGVKMSGLEETEGLELVNRRNPGALPYDGRERGKGIPETQQRKARGKRSSRCSSVLQMLRGELGAFSLF